MRLEINDQRLQYAKIFLNGERKRFVITADEERGYIERYKVNERGELIYYGDRLQAVRESGEVRIELEE